MTGAVDWSVLERLADDLDDDELVDILVTAYRGELPARRDALRSSLAASTAEMADAAHALKAASESIGALALGRTCREAEAAARAGDRTAATTAVTRALAMLDEVDAELAQGSNR